MPIYASIEPLRKGSRRLARKGMTPPSEPSADAPEAAGAEVIIAIEPVAVDHLTTTGGASVIRIPFRALTRPFLTETRATVVLGALVSPQLDAMQIAERLGELGFRGTLRLLAPALPNPTLVAREIRSASGSKDLTVELVAEP